MAVVAASAAEAAQRVSPRPYSVPMAETAGSVAGGGPEAMALSSAATMETAASSQATAAMPEVEAAPALEVPSSTTAVPSTSETAALQATLSREAFRKRRRTASPAAALYSPLTVN